MSIKYPALRVVTILLLLLACNHAFAALPSSLNYQGHLTDTAGKPVDGPVNISFAIYDVASGGTALWSETLPVTVEQGVFGVELGAGAAPFPAGMFESPLWIGLSVAADAEMTPRRPISSVGFSFKSGDADTLEGISAATLDQSAHVTDMANPHNVTAAQAGAADAAALTAHTGNTSNPHSVTAAQTGAASSANFIAHASDISAHHTRYNNAEAVAAMGVKKDSNALHHDRYSNASAVAAMLAADGAGSTLDADKVDGLQASEIIDAAQDEVRTPISSLPFTINQSGSYYLIGNLDGSTGGISITADDVTLDMMGFTIDGGGSIAAYGINFGSHSNVTIRNGTVRGFGYAGIMQGNTAARFATVIDVKALGNGTLATSYIYSGIYLSSSNSHIERCTAGDNGGYGIYAGTSSKLINNTAYNNGGTFGIYGGIGSIFSSNTSHSNTGIGIYGSTNTRFSNNTAYSNVGNGIQGGTNSSLTGNTAYSNTGSYGIYGGTGSVIKANTAYNTSGSYGIFGGGGANIIGNVAYSNDGTYGIYGSTGAILINNTAYSNSHWGISGAGSNLIKDNNVSHNNSSNTVGEGGLRVYNDSRVLGNTLDNNYRNNLYITSGDNSIIDNQMTDSTYGIYFAGASSYWRDNVSWNHTYSVGGTIPVGGYDGGGNVSF